MDKMVENSLQAQFNQERYNSQAYRYLGDCMENIAWDGFAHFMRKSADDEQMHSQKFATYLIARNVKPIYNAIDAVALSGNVRDAFKQIYDLEVLTTQKINDIYNLADDAGEAQTCNFLQFFLEEQTESVKQTYDMLQEIDRADDDAALLLLDERYGEL